MYLLCEDESYGKILFDINNSYHLTYFKERSTNVSTGVEDEIPVSLNNKSLLVIFEDYRRTYRTYYHQKFNMFPILI